MRLVKDRIPRGVRRRLRSQLEWTARRSTGARKRLRYWGLSHRCPVCGARLRRWEPQLLDAGGGTYRVSQFRLCPYCNSLERTRQALLYIRRAGLATKGATVLHFAPESGMKDYFRGIEGLVYVDTDLMMPSASVRSSITGLPFPDNSFSLIYCSHVLEHVPDDLAAMRELYRVLKPGGTALVAVPIRGATTYENPAVSTPEERFAHFGQSDHVRWYGLDIAERMAGVGFRAETAMMPDFLGCSEREKSYYQISQNHYLFLCHKPE